ncbi:MAG: RluA family pseudouridine synthase [Verrucomicrobiae bacterium]|nr:RluA family pseudouridine synthase [Verrucomicrobiae bacterium]
MPLSFRVTQPTELLPFLFASQPETKRTKVRQALKFGSVLVNGKTTTQFNVSLKVGDVIVIRLGKASREIGRLPKGMKIFFEDEHLIIIEKPENMLSIASEAEQNKTAYAYLTDYVRKGKEYSKERIWIVHRLDRETSGLMVFAKTLQAKGMLQTNWDKVEKRYLAIVEGVMPKGKGTLHSYLNETNPYRVFSAPKSQETREAITHYKVLKRGQNRTLVELTLQTGRRHQIRVQLADEGFPIIGDEKYRAKTDPAHRLGLHSHFLSFSHPITGEKLSYESDLSQELKRLI